MQNNELASNSLRSEKMSASLKLSIFTLWCLCLLTAFGVVYSTFESRQSIQALEELRREAIGLKVSAGKYQLEKSSLGAYPRIETIALKKLNMLLPESAETVLVIRE